ncbi:MAG: CocE/NonD family hydrolase [Actinomycetota bacterium]
MSEGNVFIPMPDGARLAGTLYLPETEGPWPALLEAYPYRKDDLSVWPDEYRRFRDEGDFAVCRLDVRGTGTSEGVAVAEYPPQEAEDLSEVIAWLSRQEWSTGSVGMYGSSYAGFNSIHTAMRQPPALKAIVALYATDDRYTDDIHFGGGVRKAIEFGYPLSMVSMNALPPVPSLGGSDWRERWLQRIEELVPWFRSIEHQNDGAFWRQGSLRPDYDRITVPTMLVAGWADLYRNAMLRMMERLDVPKRLVMGPWSHMLPNDSIPGPRIDVVADMIRWWDRWLRGVENGVDAEPQCAFFVQRSTMPEPDLAEMPGEWRRGSWPLENGTALALPLDSAIRRSDASVETLHVRGDVGVTAHIRGSYPPPYGLPLDQRPDEVFSLVYDWPVDEELEILGNPVLEARVSSSHLVAFVSAKLCEVFEDGTSVLVSRGLLNLTHRESDSEPTPLVAGNAYDVRIELDATSRVFQRGNRMRLAIAGADWPNAWPPPEASELSVDVAHTRLVLPQVTSSHGEQPTLVPVPVADADVDRGTAEWRIERDVYGRETRVIVRQRNESTPTPMCAAWRTEDVRVGVKPTSPGDAWVESTCESEVSWAEVTARTKARLELRSDATTYHFDLTLDVFENDERLASRHWEQTTARKSQ